MIRIPEREWSAGRAGVGRTMASRDFEYSTREIDPWRRITVVALTGGIFVSNLLDFTSVFDDVRRSKPRDVILDCENLHFISSSGIGALMKLNSEMAAQGARLWVAGLAPEIYRVFEQMKLDAILNMVPGLNDAVARIKKLGFPSQPEK